MKELIKKCHKIEPNPSKDRAMHEKMKLEIFGKRYKIPADIYYLSLKKSGRRKCIYQLYRNTDIGISSIWNVGN
jgi:hypothetical protein